MEEKGTPHLWQGSYSHCPLLLHAIITIPPSQNEHQDPVRQNTHAKKALALRVLAARILSSCRRSGPYLGQKNWSVRYVCVAVTTTGRPSESESGDDFSISHTAVTSSIPSGGALVSLRLLSTSLLVPLPLYQGQLRLLPFLFLVHISVQHTTDFSHSPISSSSQSSQLFIHTSSPLLHSARVRTSSFALHSLSSSYYDLRIPSRLAIIVLSTIAVLYNLPSTYSHTVLCTVDHIPATLPQDTSEIAQLGQQRIHSSS